MAGAFDALWQNSLGFKLAPISIRELFFITHAPCDVFGQEEGLFAKVLGRGHAIGPELLRALIQKKQVRLFVSEEGRKLLVQQHQDALIQVTRSLSIGDPIEKVRRQLNLLTINMAHLYEDTGNDQLLNLQFQCAKALAAFLIDNPTGHSELFFDYQKQKHHFIFAQPLIASLFVLGLLRPAHMFSAKEMETLFITSYFKDIGMSSIPVDKYDQKKLGRAEKRIFMGHPKQSVSILDGRLPLGLSSLKIIEHHHSFSILRAESGPDEEEDVQAIIGIESMLVMVMDMVAAMISERPYRQAASLYEALELVKRLFAEQHPQEFKLIVNYFRSFFAGNRP